MKGFWGILETIQKKHLPQMVLGSITVDCSNGNMDPMSTAFPQMASIFNQLELSLIRSRVRSDVANAKVKGSGPGQGKQIDRKPTTKDDIPAVFYKHFPAYQAGHMNASEFARICGLSRTTVYKYLKLLE